MENSEAPKARRPLPTPGVPVAVSRPEPTPSVVPAASFYASPKPPPLPSRCKSHGSSHTSYVAPPSQDPPHYSPSESYREPELVAEEPIQDEEEIVTDNIPPAEQNWASATSYEIQADWNNNNGWNGMDGWEHTTSTDWTTGENGVNTMDFDAMDYLGSGRLDQEFMIDGRDTQEEISWWNPEERERHQRPGFGILPPILTEILHNSNHSLFSVNITGSPSTAPSAQRDPSSSSIMSISSMSDSPPPSETETRMAIPHPNAYFCPKDNGWIILSWKSSSMIPPLARSYLETMTPTLPDQSRRRRTPSCIEDTGQPFGKANRTHHFHKYEQAVDSHKLTPPLRKDEWENVKQRRRTGTIISNDLDVHSVKPDEGDSVEEFGGNVTDEEGRLLDLYICCQCSFYCVASGVLSGVIPKKYMEELQRDKRGHPTVGKTPEQTIALTVETMLTAIENRLWKGNNRSIKVHSSGFQMKVGWNSNVKRIFEFLGFFEDSSAQDLTLRPPSIETTTSQGKRNRRKLLRAWVELSAWVSDFKRVHARHFIDWKEFRLYVQLDSAREMYQTAIGAHPDQIPRGGLSDTILNAIQDLDAWKGLGLTATTYSPALIGFAYLAQCRCDPAETIRYFSYLVNIAKFLHEYGSGSQLLQDLVAMEQSRERFTMDDVYNVPTILGFGSENVLHVEYDDDIPDDFVENAWKDCIKRSWRDHEHGAETHRLANDAFRVLAEFRNSVRLRTAWDNGKNIYMNPEKAYDTLEVPKDVEDYMLITVYNMRLEETSTQLEKMKEAMLCIAEVRDSERLRQFISTGTDPGEIVAPTRPDLPRGLNQLGNTCYLNSLLQYFYTIKDLREAVVPMSKLDLKALDNEKLTEEDLKRHRVGGRLVTWREIVRSRKFINQLADLFYNLEYSENPAVTPTVELAKLALVTSRDEEEDEIDKGGTDSSNDTDATLVEDGPSRLSIETSNSPKALGKSVLGKREREIDHKGDEMDIESPIAQSPTDKDGFVMVSRRGNEPEDNFKLEASSSKVQSRYTDGPSPSAPKPPPRKRTEPSDSTMMFGKQHDVAECMDNCMFQIETALLRFDSGNDSFDKTSVVKRLFYGKIRQRITSLDGQQSRSSIHEKEDLFSHLPVNVANDGIDIYDGLSGYFDDVVEFQGRKARMEVTLVDLPPILQIQLQRVQFNRETLQPYKSQAYVKYGEDLYMDRFMDNIDPSKKTRSKAIQAELNASRERVRLLVEGKETPFTTSLEHTKVFLSGIQVASASGIEDSLLQQLNDEQARVRDEIDNLRVRIDALKNELEFIWKDSREAAYELTSVFIHRGSSPSWGHYFFYSRHLPESPDSWFKYNDSDVSVVSKDEVLADTTGSTANPYLLVFARKGSDVVDTVKRFDPSKLELV